MSAKDDLITTKRELLRLAVDRRHEVREQIEELRGLVLDMDFTIQGYVNELKALGVALEAGAFSKSPSNDGAK